MNNSIVFASGTKTGGGSGFRTLVKSMQAHDFHSNIVAVVSNHKDGGVAKIAKENRIKFIHMESDFSAEAYQQIVESVGADWYLLSGWLKFVRGLPVERTINIHPGCTEKFGGKGMHGHHVHEAVVKTYKRGEISCTHLTMHFANEIAYDDGQVFYKQAIPIFPEDTPDTLGSRVNWFEHRDQPQTFDLVVTGQIYLKDNNVYVPAWYKELPCCPDHCLVG